MHKLTVPAQQSLIGAGHGRRVILVTAAVLLNFIGLGGQSAFGQVACLPAQTLVGQNQGDSFGHSVSNAGDVNSDGVDDIIVGAHRYDKAPSIGNAGRAYVYSGKDFSLLYTLTGESQQDQFGFSVSGAGDVNGDGTADLIVGAIFNGVSGFKSGRAYVFFGGPPYGIDRPAANADIKLDGEITGDYFGGSVSGAGDVNDDDIDDIIVGAWRNNGVTGAAYVYFGSDTRSYPAVISAGNADVKLTGEGTDDGFGVSVSNAGDFNNDGISDMLVGAVNGQVNANRAYVFLGRDFTNPFLPNMPAGDADFIVQGHGHFGISVSAAGYVNNDDYGDIIVGALSASSHGEAYVFLGRPGPFPLPSPVSVSTAHYTFGVGSSGDLFGHSVSGAGDINHDGFDDLIVGAPTADVTTIANGRAYTFSGANGNLMASYLGNDSYDKVGFSVANLGDLDGNNFLDEIIVGAPGDDPARSKSGIAKVYLLSETPPEFQWGQKFPATRLLTVGGKMVYHGGLRQVLQFGGLDQLTGNHDEFMSWDGTDWQNIPISGAKPDPRYDHAMSMTLTGDSILLFGGRALSGQGLGDTWAFDGFGWAQGPPGPPARWSHAMAFDWEHNLAVMYGGLDDGVWEFDPASNFWNNIPGASGPGSRTYHAMAYDPVRQVTVLFGGFTGSGLVGDTWEYDATIKQWSQVSQVGPSPRAEHSMVYDLRRGTVVLFGGWDPGTVQAYNDMWEWDGNAWRPITDVGPSPRYNHGAAYDWIRGQMVIHGGPGTADETWVYPREILTDLYMVKGMGTNGNPWSWNFTEPGTCVDVSDMNVAGVMNGDMPDIVSRFVKSINDNGSNGIRAASLPAVIQSPSLAFFFVSSSRKSGFELRVGDANNPNCLVTTNPIWVGPGQIPCIINPGIEGFEMNDTDCNGNLIDDAIDILAGTSPDLDNNGMPDECDAICCIGSTGNVDDDPDDIVDIADLTYLIDNLFINFTPLVCPAEGNIDGSGDGVVDIADLTFLIDRLFINFPPTADCR